MSWGLGLSMPILEDYLRPRRHHEDKQNRGLGLEKGLVLALALKMLTSNRSLHVKVCSDFKATEMK